MPDRVKHAVKRWALALLGRPVRCELCGQILFRTIPFVRRSRLKLAGAEYARVRADFDSMNELTFRHVQVDLCPPQQFGRQ